MPQPSIVVDDGRVVGVNSWADGFQSVQALTRRAVELAVDASPWQIKKLLKEGRLEDALTFAEECRDPRVLPKAAQMIVDQIDLKADPLDINGITYRYMLCVAFGQKQAVAKLRPVIKENAKQLDPSLKDKLLKFEIFEKNPRLLGDRPLLSLVPLP